ncbi:MAG TPA: rod shape-determining protein [Candidatus Binatia bacterium]|nr:rod shape-determining protein [Candidatus Binatia bacterium]
MRTRMLWRRLLSAGFGIDLGTANTVVWSPRRGLVLDEPSVMAIRAHADRRPRPVLVGGPARDLVGRTAVGMMTVRPLRDGVITDLEMARAFIIAILHLVARRPWERLRPQVVLGFPIGATSAERHALAEAAEAAGIGVVWLVPEPVAGALGCGVDPLDPRAHLVVDVGGGTAEVTAFCYGDILAHRSCRTAGDEMTTALFQYLRDQHGVVVGELTAEDIKLRVGADDGGTVAVEGLDVGSGRPRLVTLDAEEVVEAVRPTSDDIVQVLASCVEQLPPQTVGDIMGEGVIAFGGGAMLRGFHGLLEDALGFRVRLADQPLTCVAEGAASCLNRPEVVSAYGEA